MAIIKKTLSGVSICRGLSEGRAHIIRDTQLSRHFAESLAADKVKDEIARIKQAIQLMLIIFEYTESFINKTLAEQYSNIFAMQKVILEEPSFKQRIIQVVRDKQVKAPIAIQEVLNEYKDRLNTSHSEPMKERVSELVDLRMGLIDALDRPMVLLRNSELTGKRKRRQGRIAVAHELTARFVIEQNLENVKGILTENGGRTSHGAILCRALNIPSVSSLKNICELATEGAFVLVDGNKGRAVVTRITSNGSK
jgi:phosphoenolpyruvate-protein phosphotransferase (PTS system enzyme I)